ncbi:MAG: sodium:solute symporter [Phycisphaerales bacterium]
MLTAPFTLALAFTVLDWVVVGLYLGVLLVSGLVLARFEPKGADDYFLGGRRMPVWAVAFSIIASTLSVATFLGAPEVSFRGDLTYLSTNIGGLLAVAVVAAFFIPAFYRHNCTTIYELLEQRFGAPARYAASAAFMLGRVFASGARIYIAAIPLAMLFFGDAHSQHWPALASAILALSAVAVAYTLIGGIASVIWTDVIQVIVLLGSVVAAIVLLLDRIPADPSQIIESLRTAGPPNAASAAGSSKLTVIDPGLPFNPSSTFTLLTAVFGFSLLNMAAYGADHDMVQRMLTCRSAIRGSASIVAAIFMGIPIVALFLIIGLLLHVFYQQPSLMGNVTPIVPAGSGERAFTTFILHELPSGLRGVMIAGLFAVGLGSLNSAINAMAATAVKDFYVHLRPGRTERHYLAAGRWATVGWGVVLALFAIFCIAWKRSSPDTGLIDFALGVMNFAYSGLLAVFLAALFTRRGTARSAIAALVVGFFVVLLLQPAVWTRWAAFIPLRSGTLADISLAYPWHMLIATSLAFVTVVAPRNRESGR